MIHQQISQFLAPPSLATDSLLHGDNTMTQTHPLPHSVTKRNTFPPHRNAGWVKSLVDFHIHVWFNTSLVHNALPVFNLSEPKPVRGQE